MLSDITKICILDGRTYKHYSASDNVQVYKAHQVTKIDVFKLEPLVWNIIFYFLLKSWISLFELLIFKKKYNFSKQK